MSKYDRYTALELAQAAVRTHEAQQNIRSVEVIFRKGPKTAQPSLGRVRLNLIQHIARMEAEFHRKLDKEFGQSPSLWLAPTVEDARKALAWVESGGAA